MENQFSTQGIINLEKDLSLRKKAEKYIPGGMWGLVFLKWVAF